MEETQSTSLVSKNTTPVIQIIEYEPKQTPSVSPTSHLKKGDATNVGSEEQVPSSTGWWRSTRFKVALLFMGGMAINNSMRFNLSVAMVCMVNSTAATTSSDNSSNGSSSLSNSTCSQSNFDSVVNDYGGTFVWNSERQGLIFSAIWWSGLLTTFPGGFIADRYGPKNTLSAVALVTIVTTVLIPIMAKLGYQYMLVMRFLMGFGQGMVTPTITSAMSKWMPPSERSLVLAIMTTGNQIPAVLGNPLYAWFCTQKELFGGWPMIFYFSGFLTLGWLIVWALFMSNRPEKHRSINRKELKFIQYSLRNQNVSGKRRAVKVPWLKLAKSRVIWAIMFMNFAASFSNFTFSTYIPTYFKEVLYFDIRKNGLLSTLPFITQFLSKFMWTYLGRQLVKHTNISQTTTSAILNSIGSFGQSTFLIILSFLDCNHSGLAVVLLCCAQAMTSAIIPGFMVSFLSVAPIFTGTVRSCASIMAQIGGFTSPYLVGSLTKNGTRLEWQLVFISTAVILCSANIVWICCGTTEIQPWAMVESEDDSKPTKTTEEQNNSLVELETDDSTQNHDGVLIEKF